MNFKSAKVNGEAVTDYQVTDKKLIIGSLPKGDFVLEIESEIKPQVRATARSVYLIQYSLELPPFSRALWLLDNREY